MSTERFKFTFEVELTREAENDLQRLRPWTEQATRAILRLEEHPYLGHALTGSLQGARSLEFSLRGGGVYRAAYVVLDDSQVCLVFIVGPHENIYDNAERRVAALPGIGTSLPACAGRPEPPPAGHCRFPDIPFDYKAEAACIRAAGRFATPMCGVSREEKRMTRPIAPCLWFENNAEEAVNYYVSVFKDSKVLHVDRFSDVGPDPEAPVVFIEFQINGQPFQAINGGPLFSFSEAISFAIECANQEEVDYYWNTLIDGGEPSQCGWLKDRYGVSWQVVPRVLSDLLRGDDRERAGQAMRKMLQMTKLDIAELEAAYNQ